MFCYLKRITSQFFFEDGNTSEYENPWLTIESIDGSCIRQPKDMEYGFHYIRENKYFSYNLATLCYITIFDKLERRSLN